MIDNRKVISFRDRILFLLLASCVFGYVIARAALVPWVHDESTSIYWFVERGEFLPYVALWDAGNHFLSSAIGILSHEFWGLSLIGSRVGSLIAFVLFAFAALRLGEFIVDRRLRWIGWIALLTCPFLLDFFSLFRGYALGMAFWSIAIDGAVRYSKWRKPSHLVQLLLSLFLADLAVLSLVPLWALITVVIGGIEIYRWQRSKAPFSCKIAAIWSFLGVLPLMFGLLLAWEMRRRGLLYHGSTEGFIDVTVSSLCNYVLGTDHILVIISVCTVIAGVLYSIVTARQWRSIPAGLAALLLADVLMRIGMAWILGVNYPEDRAALHMVPLAILLVVFTADGISDRKWLQWCLVIPLIFLPLRSLFTFNFDHTQLWPEQSVPTRFLQQIAKLQEARSKPVVIGAYHQLSYAIPYAARLHGSDLQPPDVIGFPEGLHDVRIVDQRFLGEALVGYQEIDRSPGNGLHLLVREAPMALREIDHSSVKAGDKVVEFIELWRPDSSEHGSVRLEIEAVIDSPLPFLDLLLVSSQKHGSTSVHYNTIPVSHFRPKWSGEKLRMVINFQMISGAEKVVYFWNVDRVPIELSEIEVRVYQVIENG